jgi:hypothetical protein
VEFEWKSIGTPRLYFESNWKPRIRKVIEGQLVLRSKTLGEATVPLKMARDEARHGVALKGLLERYFK